MLYRFLLFSIYLIGSLPSFSQGFSMNNVPIDDWELGNFKQVENVVNPFLKRKKNTPDFSTGKQFLYANTPAKMTSKLTTADANIKFDFMLGKNSEAFYYIQGKYPINLTDGTIITKNGSIKLPTQNASREVGLWQNLEITFSAAPFENALIIEKLILNGITIHQGLVLVSEDIKEGPISFENKAGTLAIRNVAYLKYNKKTPLKLSNLNYKLFETYDWDKQFAIKKETPNETGKALELTKDYGAGLNRFLLIFNGNLEVEEDGNYSLIADYAGKGSLSVDGKEVLPMIDESYRKPRVAYLNLKKGTHSIELKYIKVWWKAELGLFAAGPEIRPYPLHAETSLPTPQAVGEIAILPQKELEIVRSFIIFGGKKRTHVISVGNPVGVHFTYDLNQAALLYAWKGAFADVTEMWHERGEPQLLEPKGVRTQFSGKPSIFSLNDPNATLPDSLDAYTDLVYKGYQLNANGSPTFQYQYNGSTFSQSFTPNNGILTANISANNITNLYYRLAEGKSITELEKGIYLIDNQYIQINEKTKPIIRNTSNGQVLLFPLSENFSYSISW